MGTIRQEMILLIEEKQMTARDLSKELKISEKEVYTHLSHIQKTIKPLKKKLLVEPFQCQVCDFIFKERKRLTRPGRCPECKQGHISPATYRIN
jgi:predicted Zn-ribbon and HTH transcriptional regulator